MTPHHLERTGFIINMDINVVASTDFISQWLKAKRITNPIDHFKNTIRDFLMHWSKGKVKKIYMVRDNYCVKPTENGRYSEDRHEHIDAAIVDNDYLTEITFNTLMNGGYACDICNDEYDLYYFSDDYSPSYTHIEKGPINQFLCKHCRNQEYVLDSMTETQRLSIKPVAETTDIGLDGQYLRSCKKICCVCCDDDVAYVYQEIMNYDLCPKCYSDLPPDRTEGFVLDHGSFPPKKQYPYGPEIETIESVDATYYKIYYEYTAPDGTNYEYILHYTNSCCDARDVLMRDDQLSVEDVIELLSASIEWLGKEKPELDCQKLYEIWWEP